MIWHLLTGKRASVVGAEWAAGLLRLVQLDLARLEVIRLAERRLAPGEKVNGEAVDSHQQAAFLRQVWRQAGFRGRDVYLSLGPGELFLQNIRLPQDAANVDAAVCAEVANRIPYPLEEMELRYVPAGTVRQGENIRQEVIVFACQRKAIEHKLAVVDEAGLRCQGIDVHPAALLRCYRFQLRREADRQQPIAFVSVRETGTLVVAGSREQPYFVKSVEVTSGHFDEAVARSLGLSVEEAAALRRHQGDRRQDNRDPELSAAIAQATVAPLERLAAEVALCLRYCSVTFRGQAPREIILSGAEATADHAEVLSRRLGVPVRAGNPFLPFKNAPTAGIPGRWDIALGLALSKVNR
ncbi:MAG: pilus assembly protein PilM [Thermoguttaceae bacterium]|nr:pilus assembly protein PilM [Thermoguttaceae bacterium]MDW8078941.1 pilus assembly protein PilM [Thermoguttaceae bacterium]